MRAIRVYTYLGTVQGMCRSCREIVACRIIEAQGSVYQERLCPACGPSRARIADGLAWYLDRTGCTVRHEAPANPMPVARGCPHDCGPCAFHANRCHLPVFSVTNACNLRCPICFTYNRPEPRYFMSREELRRLLDGVEARSGSLDLVNITGGEPTLHPEILSLLDECRRPGIGRVTMNSNGLRLASDPALCSGLAERGVYCVLSFHTLRSETSVRMHGRDIVREKLLALEKLETAGVGTTLLLVLARGVNEDAVADVVRLAKERGHIRSITVQTMSFTGQGGGDFGPREHLPLDGVEAAFEEATGGEIRREHFLPHPRAHPLCYSVAFYLRGRSGLHSLTEFLTREELRGLLSQGYLLRLDGSSLEVFRAALDRLWARDPASEILPRLKSLLSRLYPQGAVLAPYERQRICEEEILPVYLHAHMDEDTLDLARLVACPDQVPDPEGRSIPACAYNLFYRRKDERFYEKSTAGDAERT